MTITETPGRGVGGVEPIGKAHPGPGRIAFLLTFARRQAGLTREQVAERIGVTVRAVESWEGGWREPRMARLEDWAGAVGKSIAVITREVP